MIMEERKYESFFEYCYEHLLEKLKEYESTSEYACDLGYKLCEDENVNGTLTFSTYEAKQYLKEWWDECGEYLEYENFNFGENRHNPFENPEAFMVCMVIAGVNSILCQCESINEAWNDKVELNEKFLEKLRGELEYVTKIQW